MNLFKDKKPSLPPDAEDMNLCYLGNDGYQAQGTEKYRKIVGRPGFVCQNCGRAAHSPKNLCRPDPRRPLVPPRRRECRIGGQTLHRRPAAEVPTSADGTRLR